MSAGTMTMACLMLLNGQATSEIHYTNKPALRLPIAPLEPARRAEVSKLLLFYTADRGKNWQQCATVGPDKDEFIFHAPGDGEYWLRMATVDRGGKQDPDNLYRGQPDQFLIVDTRPPLVKITSAQRAGDEAVVGWEVTEDHPDPESLTIEYRMLEPAPAAWVRVPLTPAAQGQARAKLPAPGPFAVRLRMRDRAGNASSTETTVGAAAQASHTAPQTPPGAESTGLPLPPTPAPMPGRPDDPRPTLADPPPPPAVATPPVPKTTPGTDPQAMSAQPRAPQEGPSGPAAEVVASSASRPAGAAPRSAPEALPGATPRRQQPPTQYVNDSDILIEFAVSRVGPGGVGSVHVYLTQNGGEKWEHFAEDRDPGSGPPAKSYQRTLKLPGEGVYGLTMVVLNKADIGKRPPQDGDAPEMVVEVDLTPPVASLRRPVADPQRRDALLLQWTASDKNLGPRPVTLEWAANRTGPWNTIAEVENSGRHSWVPPPQVPVRAYLRLRVRDLAGNEAVAATDEPMTIDLTEPESQLINVRPAPRGQ